MSLESTFRDTVKWAEAHGFDIPGFEPNGETTIEAALRQIAESEMALAQQAGACVQLRLAKMLLDSDRVRYDNARMAVYTAQTNFYAEIHSSRLWNLLVSMGLQTDIPVPRLAPAASVMFPPLPATTGVAGVGGLGVVPLVAAGAAVAVPVGWAAAVLGALIFAAAVAVTAVAASYAYTAKINSESHRTDADNRMEVYRGCIERGGNDRVCAATANQVSPDAPPGANTPGWVKALKTGAWYVGGAALIGGVGYLGFVYLTGRSLRPSLGGGRRARGMRGLGRAGSPKRLRGMDDEYPSSYFLEV